MTTDINTLALAYAATIVNFHTVQLATPPDTTRAQRRAYVEARSEMFAAWNELKDAGLREAKAANAKDYTLFLDKPTTLLI